MLSLILIFFVNFPCFSPSRSSVRSYGWCMGCGRCFSFFFFISFCFIVFFFFFFFFFFLGFRFGCTDGVWAVEGVFHFFFLYPFVILIFFLIFLFFFF